MFSSKSRGVHSHIKGLGLGDQGLPIDSDFSILGQEEAREAAGLVVEMVRQKKMAGRGVLLTGPSGCGKTALAVAISEELGLKTPFNILNSSEVYSAEVKKSEILHEALRKSILVRIREYKNIYEGEVVNLDIVVENKNVEEINITLRSTKGTKSFKISTQLFEQINQQRIRKGDVIYIESSAGIIKKLGRGESHMNDFDLESEKYVPLPKGDIFRKKEIFQETTLHSLDLSFVHPTGQDVLSLVSQVLTPRKTEITDRLRNEVDLMVSTYIEVGKAEIIPGILFIDEASMLDKECIAYLHKAMDSPQSPTIILASNRIDNLDFGDFLDRLLVISVGKNSLETERKIIETRLSEEEVEMSKEALERLSDLCRSKSLRFCLSLISLLKTFNHEVTKEEVEELAGLFSE